MAIANALNRDPFLTGGVMDAPDPVVRSAMAKMMNPQGLPPMTQKELNRLLNRQYLEQENIRQSNTASQQTTAIRAAIASGQMAPIDVTKYAGSMYAAPGSYAAARPMAQQGGYNPERTADALLKAQFGQMLPGQQVRIAGVPDEMLVPAGQPEQVESVGQTAAPAAKPGSVIEQLIGRPLSLFDSVPPSVYQPTPSGPTVNQVMGMTPMAQQQRLAQERFAADQREALRKQTVGTLASMVALGQDITQFDVSPDILNEAAVEGAKLSQYTKKKFPTSQKSIEGGIVYEQQLDPETGEPIGSKIPLRSTQQLPGTAKPVSQGQFVPAVNMQTGQPIPGMYLDTSTGAVRNVVIPGTSEQVLKGLGLDGGSPGTPTPVVTPQSQPSQFVKGQRVVQNGRVYEYNGKTFNEVK
jgi:hypothetical protein